MPRAVERLAQLTVADVMARDVLHVSADQTLDEVAATLVRHDVSGVPVVDETGRCVGVLSARDFVRARYAGDGSDPALGMQSHELEGEKGEGPIHIVATSTERAGNAMSGAVQSIRPEATLLEAGRIMTTQHVHRLPVLDADGRLLGMVTSTDIVAATVAAIEEMQSGQ